MTDQDAVEAPEVQEPPETKIDRRPTIVLSLAPTGALEVEQHPSRPMPTVQQVATMAALLQQDVHCLAVAQTVTALFHQAVKQQAQASVTNKVVIPKRSLASLKKGRLS